MGARLTHLDEEGRAQMVDVGGKPETARVAVARGLVEMRLDTLRLIAEGRTPKGDVLAVARVAGIMAAKQTSSLIPLCHPLILSYVGVDFESAERDERGFIGIRSEVHTTGKTGAELEALTAVSVAALTIYDMVKAADRAMRITEVRLVSKMGGKSGTVATSEDTLWGK